MEVSSWTFICKIGRNEKGDFDKKSQKPEAALSYGCGNCFLFSEVASLVVGYLLA